jgi:hypothetical protein
MADGERSAVLFVMNGVGRPGSLAEIDVDAALRGAVAG